jgi:hypothetical protein
MSVCEVFEIIRSGGYFILYFFSSKTDSSSYGKKINAHPILKSSPSVTVDSEFIFFGTNLSNISHYSFNNAIDFVRSLMQNIKFLVRFYFVGGTIHPI